MEVYKVIRDSVHGNIELERSFVENILDTPYFQRLRRIEQSSVRAIYPCARHDRFTHSLGVYHVGTKIVENLKPQISKIKPLEKNQIETITKSYLIACLLHDIAHAPFSHTFESYYGDVTVLYDLLKEKLGKDLVPDRLNLGEIKEHELASAILVADKFKDSIQSPNLLGGDLELVCRMIIGAPYSENTTYYQICNCFIKLLHGEVDADRLDYACRDIWSSGYKSVSIDINRVIHAMHIELYKDSYELCFNHNVIGDIRNVMELKRFQKSHIFNHHTIVYDQELLVQAAETMASEYFDNAHRPLTLSDIICLDAVEGEKNITNTTGAHQLRLLGDDDLYFLMKQSNNIYFKELSSRTYKRFALWKSPEEFYAIFPTIDKTINITNKDFAKKVKKALKQMKADLMDEVEILTREVTYKERASIDDLLIVVHNEPKPYHEVRHDIFKETSGAREFSFTYLYVPKPKKNETLEKIRKKAIELVRPVVEELFKAKTCEKDICTKVKDYLVQFGCNVDISKATFSKRDISQLKRMLTKFEMKPDSLLNKLATDLLTLIISSQEGPFNVKSPKQRMRRARAPKAPTITQKDIDELNRRN